MSHTFTYLCLHVVFSTKDRRPSIRPDIKERLFAYLGGIVREKGGTALLINGMPDHVHLLLTIPPNISVADILRTVKANSSKWVHETWPQYKDFSWQQGYGAFSVSKSSLPDVHKYVANQEEHHRRLTFDEEFRALLIRHEVEFDERFLWK
jgi:REP element-mobilizing transposase RayT